MSAGVPSTGFPPTGRHGRTAHVCRPARSARRPGVGTASRDRRGVRHGRARDHGHPV